MATKKSLSKARRRYRRQVGLNRKHLKTNTRPRYSKLDLHKDDIVLITSIDANPLSQAVEKALLDKGASYIIRLRIGETIESITPQLFQEAISKVVGEKARQAIMNHVEAAKPKRQSSLDTSTTVSRNMII